LLHYHKKMNLIVIIFFAFFKFGEKFFLRYKVAGY
jgi:hypothetical protein